MALAARPLTILLWSAIFLPTLAAALYLVVSYDERLTRTKSELANQALILREHALRVLEAQLSAIDYIDTRLEGMSWEHVRESAALHATLKQVAEASPHIDGIWLIPPDGRTANSADYFPIPPDTDASERDYFKALKERDETYLGEMIRGYLKGNLKFSLSRRRSSHDGLFNGLILITGDIDYFNDFWARVLEPGEIAAILRSDGAILARHPKPEHLPPKIALDSPFFIYAANDTNFLYQHVSRVDDTERIYAMEKLGNFSAFIGVGVGREVLMSSWWPRSAIVAASALALSAALSMLVMVARRYQRRLELETGLREGAEHQLSAKEEQVAALEAAEARVRASEKRFRALFDTNTQGVLHLDRQNTVLSSNPAAQKLLGFPEEEIVGGLTELGVEILDENGVPLARDQLPGDIAIRHGETLKDFLLGLRRRADGPVQWLLTDAVPQWREGERDPWSVFLLLRDVTEQRRAAQTERVLAAEVDHRAKNMLALVLSLVRLSKADSPEDLVTTIEGRVSALASAHNLLARSRWGEVNLSELVHEILAPYQEGNDRRISTHGPGVTLKASAAQSLILMLHELATNAAKYGALSVSEGQLRISWEVRQEDKLLRFNWKESRGPTVQEPEQTSFGSRLIRLAIEGDLGGKVEKEWKAEGLELVAELPLYQISTFVEDREPEQGPKQPVAIGPGMTPGMRILIVEDSVFIAAELAQQIRAIGCVVEKVAHTLEEAELCVEGATPDVAVLDVDIHGSPVFPLAERLRERGVMVMFCTGFSSLSEIETEWPDAIVLQKPVTTGEIKRALQNLSVRMVRHR